MSEETRGAFLYALRMMGANITSDAEYEEPAPGEITIRGDKLISYHPSLLPGNMTKVVVPSGIKVIGNGCFLGPDKMHNDYMAGCILPEGVIELQEDAFALCRALQEITVPSTLRKIGAGAFQYSGIESIDLPEGLRSIGDYAFMSCRFLKELRVPSTVKTIGESCFSMMGTPLGSNSSGGIVYLPSSLKERYSDEYLNYNGLLTIKWYEAGRASKAVKNENKKTTSKPVKKPSSETRKKTPSETGINSYDKEKCMEDMYVILYNEKKLGKLRRAQKEFCDVYAGAFPSMKKTEIINLRKEVIALLNDADQCAKLESGFRQRTVRERYDLVTTYYYNAVKEPDIGKRAKLCVDNTREWYMPEEYSEVDRMMETELDDLRKNLDEKLGSVKKEWTTFSTAAELLRIVLSQSKEDGSDLVDDYSCFQILDKAHPILRFTTSVKIYDGEKWFAISTNVMNSFPWYWGVTIRDIWEAAAQNEIVDERQVTVFTEDLVDSALDYIRSTYPETTGVVKQRPQKTSQAADERDDDSSQFIHEESSNSKTIESRNPAQVSKREGCYIATAVYGSYDAAQVLTLRRFRDEVLQKTVFGRWFIRTYYRLSPPIANKLKNAKLVNRLVRSLLDVLVRRLEDSRRS